MTFFLLSIFWGNHLYFGEAFGEFASIIIVLLSVMVLGFDRFSALSICAVIYFLYCIISYGIFRVHSIFNYLFIFCAGGVIVIWFILLGLRLNADKINIPAALDQAEPQPSEKES